MFLTVPTPDLVCGTNVLLTDIASQSHIKTKHHASSRNSAMANIIAEKRQTYTSVPVLQNLLVPFRKSSITGLPLWQMHSPIINEGDQRLLQECISTEASKERSRGRHPQL